jgi:hypothetical protein
VSETPDRKKGLSLQGRQISMFLASELIEPGFPTVDGRGDETS